MFAKGRDHKAVQTVAVPKHALMRIGARAVFPVSRLVDRDGGRIDCRIDSRRWRANRRTCRLRPKQEVLKRKRPLRQGHPEGVIAAESANNAMVGPSLVPLLTLSIPGSPTAAVLLGGLLIHGIFPGSDLFDNHPEVAWTFINSMLIGQLLMVAFGIYTAVWAARIARAPVPILAAAVLILSVFGAYSVQQSMGDVLVMFSLGLMMYALVRFGFSAAPLVLGLILGPIAEANFIQGSMIANAMDGPGAYFFGGPLNQVLIALVVASVAYSFIANRNTAPADGDARRGGASRIEHSVSSVAVLLVASTVCWLSFTVEPADAFLFPRLIAVFFVGFALWNAARALSGRARVGDGITAGMGLAILPGLGGRVCTGVLRGQGLWVLRCRRHGVFLPLQPLRPHPAGGPRGVAEACSGHRGVYGCDVRAVHAVTESPNTSRLVFLKGDRVSSTALAHTSQHTTCNVQGTLTTMTGVRG